MKQVRIGVFETNSSSTHSMVICTEEEFNKWMKGEVLMNLYEDTLVPVNEIPSEDMYDYGTVEQWEGDLESSRVNYTSKSGDKIVILAKYGYQ